MNAADRARFSGHTLYGCVDWNSLASTGGYTAYRHTLYGCVDWNNVTDNDGTEHTCHTLYGCVDWNSLSRLEGTSPYVTPCMGVWIET